MFPVFTEEFKIQYTATTTFEHPNEKSDFEAGNSTDYLKCGTRRSIEARKQLQKYWNVRATKETLDFIQFLIKKINNEINNHSTNRPQI